MKDNEYLSADSGQIAPAMLAFLNTWKERPSDFSFEAFGDSIPAMRLSQMSGPELLRSYVDGGYIAVWPFAVSMRIRAYDSSDALAAAETLNSLSDWLKSGPMPELGDGKRALEFKITALPSQSGIYENGTEEYHVLFRMEYARDK